MRTLTAIAGLALVAACGTGTAAAPAPTTTPTPAAATASPTPTRDPACALDEMRAFLASVDRYHARGAFKVNPDARLKTEDVERWFFQIGAIERAADLKVYKTVNGLRDTVNGWLLAEPGSFSQRIRGTTIGIAAHTLALECGVHNDYAFSRLDGS